MKILGKTPDGNLIVEMSQQEWDEPDKRLRSGWTPPNRSLKALGLPKRIENILNCYLPAICKEFNFSPTVSSIEAIHFVMIRLPEEEFCSYFRQFSHISYGILKQKMIDAGFYDLGKK